MCIIQSLRTSDLYVQMIIFEGSLLAQCSNLCPSSIVGTLGVASAQLVLRLGVMLHCVFNTVHVWPHIKRSATSKQDTGVVPKQFFYVSQSNTLDQRGAYSSQRGCRPFIPKMHKQS